MSQCSQIKVADPQAGLICQEITKHYQVDAKNLPDTESVYKTAIDIAVREAKNNFDRLKKIPDNAKFKLESPFLRFLNKKTDLKLTFIFEDIGLLKTIAAHEGELSTLTGLQHFVSEILGIQFKGIVDSNPDPLDAVRKKEGNCLDFVNLYFGISLLMGNPVHLIDDIGPDGDEHHVLAETNGKYLDPEDGFLETKPSNMQYIDPLNLVSLYHYNKAHSPECENLESREVASCQWPHINKAKKLSPKYFRILYSWGRLQLELFANKKNALKAFQEVYQLNAHYVFAKNALDALQNRR